MATIDTRTPRLNLPVPVVTNALKDDCRAWLRHSRRLMVLLLETSITFANSGVAS